MDDLKLNQLSPFASLEGAFITGSYAFGIPTEKSDLDMVVKIHPDDYGLLSALSDEPVAECECEQVRYGTLGGAPKPLRFGKLNLICCVNQAQMDCWRDGTNELVLKSPVTREAAVEVFTKLRAERLC